MSKEKKILKFGETTNFGAGSTFGVNQNVTFRSTRPDIATVNNSGRVEVISAPSKVERIAITAVDSFGIPLGSQIIYVIPTALNKNNVFRRAGFTLTEKYLKPEEISQFTVDYEGVIYSTSTTNLVTINSTGLVTCVANLDTAKQVMLYGKDVDGFVLASTPVVILPTNANKEKLTVKPVITVNINAGA